MMPEKTKLMPGHCKTCKTPIGPGELRCEKHEGDFRQWLAGAPSTPAADYRPRFNGVIGLYDGEITRQMHISRSRSRLTRGLRAGEELKFD